MARMVRAAVAVGVAVSLALLVVPSSASASQSHAGRWVSDSKSQSGFGYILRLKPGTPKASGYTGVLRFSYPDGRIGSSVLVTAHGQGDRLVIKARDGSFDRSGRTLRASVDPRTGSMTLVNCQQRLRLVMSWALDTDCVLRR